MADQQSPVPPGWYPDPQQPGRQREWNGYEWVGPSVPIGAKGGFPKWLIPVIACLALGFVAVIGGAIAGGDPDEARVDRPPTTEPDGFARCNDDSISDNPDPDGICSSHDGISEWLAEYGECEDGTVIALRDDPQCPNSGDLARLRPDYVPEVGPDDIALCADGTYSDNRDLTATCSSHDGVEGWLADYGRCEGGEVIRLDDDPRCPGGDDLQELMPPDFTPPTEPPSTTTTPTTVPPTTTPPTTTTAPPATAPPTTPPPATAPPSTAPPAPPAPADVYYANCDAARAAGAAPIYVGEPGYRPALDRDGDGVACE